MTIFAERLKELKKERRVTYKPISEKTGISLDTLVAFTTEYEKDRYPSWFTLKGVAQYFGVTVDWLMGISDQKFPLMKAEWQPSYVDDDDCVSEWECSNCGTRSDFRYKCCPECGCEMRNAWKAGVK